MSELVFISVFNFGGIEIAINHLESLKINNIQNYIAFVTDDESYRYLHKLGYKVVRYLSDNITNEKSNFGSVNFNNLSYLRYNIINSLLIKGKSVWYLDIDTVVLSNLNEFYGNLNKNFDVYFQNDINMLCTGCMLFMPNIRTLNITKHIYSHRNSKDNDQIIFNNILQNGPGLKFTALNPNQFPNGLLYFMEVQSEPYFKEAQEKFKNSNEKVLLVHANYMSGIDTKIDAFKRKNLWFI